MGLSLIAPWRADWSERSANWDWLRRRWEALLPGVEVIEADTKARRFAAAPAVNDGVSQASGDVVVIAWADTFVSAEWISHAIGQVMTGAADVVVPAQQYMVGRWTALDLIAQPVTVPPPSRLWAESLSLGWSGLAVTSRAQAAAFPFDERFDGWGHEGDAWLIVNETFSRVERYDASYHLWHNATPETTWASRRSADRRYLFDQYARAAGDRSAILELLGESSSPRTACR